MGHEFYFSTADGGREVGTVQNGIDPRPRNSMGRNAVSGGEVFNRMIALSGHTLLPQEIGPPDFA